MRKFLSLGFLIALASCTTTAPISNGLSDEYNSGRDHSAENLVIMRNGDRITPAKITSPNYGALHYNDQFITVDGKKTYYRDMSAWQYKNVYTAMVRGEKGKDDYPVSRIRSGKINLYIAPDSGELWEYLFDKGDFKITRATYADFSAAVSDNADALALLNNLFPKHSIVDDRTGQIIYEGYTRDKLCRVLAVYNR